ncbi:site-specific integrase [Segatella copri]|uniref:site-specific integrase n=1 Tax=Segatella copri TaxID=165179 RepID=UPI00129263BA|nr:site-specific integrase [Segatella copri]
MKRSGNDRGYLEIDEVKKLIETPCNDEQIKMAFLFACFCGLRLSDVKDMKWKDIKFDADGGAVVSKVQVKTRQSIVVPLSANALMWLPDRGKAKDNEPVYDLPTHFTINRSVKKWAKDAQIEKNVTFHLSSHNKIFYQLNINGLSNFKNVTANDLETSYILFLSQLCYIKRTL